MNQKRNYCSPVTEANYFLGAEPVMAYGKLVPIRRTSIGIPIVPGGGSNNQVPQGPPSSAR